MRNFWTRAFLTRRIDRCYLIAAWTKGTEKRKVYLELARYYRRLLSNMSDRSSALQAVLTATAPISAVPRAARHTRERHSLIRASIPTSPMLASA